MDENQNPPNPIPATVVPGATGVPPVTDLYTKVMQVFDALLSESLDQSDLRAAVIDVTTMGLHRHAFRVDQLIEAEWPSNSNSIEVAGKLLPLMDVQIRLTKQAAQYEQLKRLLAKRQEKS
jgi:hypothetical protein